MRRVDFSGLGVRLAAATLAIGLAGWAVGSVVLRSSAGGSLRSEAEEVSRAVADRLASDLDARVDGLIANLDLLATRTEVLTLSSGAGTELAVAMRTVPAFDFLVLRDVEGRAVAATASQRVVATESIEPRLELVEAVGTGGSVVRAVGDGAVEIELAVPVESPPGTIVGVLEGHVPLELAVQALQVRLLGESTRAIVTASDGRILSHPERRRVLDGERYPIEELEGAPDRVATLGRDDGDVIAAVAFPNDFPGTVIVEEDEGHALARLDDELAELTWLLALVVGVTVLAVLVLGNRLVQPLVGLARTLRRFGDGDRTARAHVAGSSEFRAVATEVNRMADGLEAQITALETAQRELRALQERFRAAFEEAPVAMALALPDESLVQVNPPMAQLMGRTVDELQALGLRELTHPDDQAKSQAALDRAARTGSRLYRTERRYLRPDGVVVPALTNVAIVRDSSGDPDYLIVHAVDLSELRAAEERLRHIIESSPDVLLIASLDGTIEMINQRVSDAFGYSPDDVVGKAVEVLIPERLRDLHVGHRTGYATEPRTRDMGAGLALFGRRSDGSEFPVEVSLSPLDVDGETRVIAVVRDVTERKRGEEVARELREMQMLQRQAVEINDNIVQGLTIARWSFDLEQVDVAKQAVERTIEAARALVDRMLEASGEIVPGSLTRERPAEFPR